MKCISCEVEINPKWKHAIDINLCPFCGKEIMDSQLKDLLTSLADLMTKMQGYSEQLNDWMLSNYNFIKTDSPKLIDYLPKEEIKALLPPVKEATESKKYIVKVKTEAGEQDIEAEKIQSEERTNEFFKRAEAIKPNLDGFNNLAEKTQHLKKMALQIRRAGSTMVGDNTPDLEVDSEISSEMSDLFESNYVKSSLDNSVDDDIPAVVLNMANKKNNKTPADLLKLQKMQDRVLESKKNFESGASRGKGSFSRA